MANEESPFQLVPFARVKEKVRAIAENARKLGLFSLVNSCMQTITEKLEKEPEQWGDPLYATEKAGGMVYRGFLPPFVVRYAVYAEEKLVALWDIRVLDDHPLASR